MIEFSFRSEKNICSMSFKCQNIQSKKKKRAAHMHFWYRKRFFWFFFVFLLFRAIPAAYGVSQARGRIGATAACLRQSHSNTRSLTHWASPGIERTISWLLVGFVSAAPQWELQKRSYKTTITSLCSDLFCHSGCSCKLFDEIVSKELS